MAGIVQGQPVRPQEQGLAMVGAVPVTVGEGVPVANPIQPGATATALPAVPNCCAAAPQPTAPNYCCAAAATQPGVPNRGAGTVHDAQGRLGNAPQPMEVPLDLRDHQGATLITVPEGALPGGRWITQQFIGETTFIISCGLFFCGCAFAAWVPYLFPCDHREVYISPNRYKYTLSGQIVPKSECCGYPFGGPKD